MRLKKERVNRKKLGNLTVIADKVNIVSPSGRVGGLKMGGGVQAPKRQYQFSYNLDQGAVTNRGDTVPVPEGPPPEPENPVGNALGRIGTMLGQAALSYAGQALFNRAMGDFSNWMHNDRTDANVAAQSPTSPGTLWSGIEPLTPPTTPGSAGSPGTPGSWPGIEPVPSPAGSPTSIYTLAGDELEQHQQVIRRGPLPPPINTNLRGGPTDIAYSPTPGTAGSWPGIEPVPSPARTAGSWPGIEPVPSPASVYYSAVGSPQSVYYSARGTATPSTPSPYYVTPTSSPSTPGTFYVPSSSSTNPSPSGEAPFTPPYAQYAQPGVWAGNMSPNEQVFPVLSPTTSGGSSSPESGTGLGARYGALGTTPINTTGMVPRTGMNLINLASPPEVVAAETNALAVQTQGMNPRTGMNMINPFSIEGVPVTNASAPAVYDPPPRTEQEWFEGMRTYRSRDDQIAGYGDVDYAQFARGSLSEEKNQLIFNYYQADENLKSQIEKAVRGNPEERAARLEQLRRANPMLFLTPVRTATFVQNERPGSPITPSTATTDSTIESPAEPRFQSQFRPITAAELRQTALAGPRMRGVRPPPLSLTRQGQPMTPGFDRGNQRMARARDDGDAWIPTRRSQRRYQPYRLRR